MMEYRLVGRSKLKISRLGLGCELLGGVDWGAVDLDSARAAVAAALDAGITYFDTADVYGLGFSERRLSEALGDSRSDVVIGSKFGIAWRTAGNRRAVTYRDASPAHVVAALEDSLRRLRLDCIPLYFIHWPDANTPIEATMEALARCRQAGKIAEIGLSNFPAPLIRRAHAVAPVAVVQFAYNLASSASAGEALSVCRELGVAVFAHSPLAQGLLSGKYDERTAFAENDRRRRLPLFQDRELAGPLLGRLRATAARLGKPCSVVALRWILENPAIASLIVGVRSPLQLDENLGALGWRLVEDEYLQLMRP